MDVLARHWEKLDGQKVRCNLCPHRCVITKDGSGICLIRKNLNGELHQTAYGQPCSISIDPVEKKPLYHYFPGQNILSVGTNGCNMRCHFCQNWQISTKETRRHETTTEELYKQAVINDSFGIAYTYNEPLIWYEFVYDCSKFFRENDLKNVLITNGQINSEPLAELLPLIDALNVDLKGFTEEFYKNEAGDLQATLNTIEASAKAGKHIELTNLLIPDMNDDPIIFEEMCRYIAEVSKDIPLHLSRYFPQHKSNRSVTSDLLLTDFRTIALKYLNYVYIGNANIRETSDTRCPDCGEIIIERSGYKTICHTDENKCKKCSKQLYLQL